MNYKKLVMVSKYVLVISGLLWAYEGATNIDLTENLLGTYEPTFDIIVFGGAAVVLGYHLMNKRGKS